MSGFSLGALQRLMEDLEESLREREHRECTAELRVKNCRSKC